MDLTFQVPVQYCSLQQSPASITSPTHSLVLFLLWLHLFILYGVISPLISSSILGTYQPGEFIFQCPIFLPFHTVHGVLKARIMRWLREWKQSSLKWEVSLEQKVWTFKLGQHTPYNKQPL